MYNRNYGGFDYTSTLLSTGLNPPRPYRTAHSGAVGIANASFKPKINAYKPVTDGCARPS